MRATSEPQPGTPRVVVVGGGIAGLAAAWFLRQQAPEPLDVSVLEAAAQIGGKLRATELAGLPVDEGAESLLARRPEAVRLARDVGLSDAVVHPRTTAASVWTRGALRQLPARHLMGVPVDLRSLGESGILSPAGLARLSLDHLLPATPLPGDVAVGAYVAARLGQEVVDRLVEPLLGGVYAGHADQLSLEATVPQLARAARAHRSLLAGAAEVRAGGPGSSEPVFAGITGGVGRLPGAVAAASGARVSTGTTVRELRQDPAGFSLVTGPARAPEVLAADAVIVAVPARAASRVLAEVAPVASYELGGIDYASVAVMSAVFAARDLATALPAGLPGSGFLVPPVEGRLVKAATFSTSKWSWLSEADADLVAVRMSVGRHEEVADLQHDDDELSRLAVAELGMALGAPVRPLATLVSRWGGSLPQYAVGHLQRIARVRSSVAETPGLAVCGAAYDGVGVAACVAGASEAAAQVLRHLSQRRQWAHG